MKCVTKGANEQNWVTQLSPLWVETFGIRQRRIEQSGERLLRPSSSSGLKMARPTPRQSVPANLY